MIRLSSQTNLNAGGGNTAGFGACMASRNQGDHHDD